MALDNTEPNLNRLAKEKSPYLFQHAHNPVDWFPWGEEALEKARGENKPIFLSIGYSSCHFCHRMENESFMDKEIADILNRDFISIKVDREERPDLDFVYMMFAQNMTGRGGWPLTIIMTPEQKPFYAATYLPKVSHGNVPGLLDLLPLLAGLWQEQNDAVLQNAAKIYEYLQNYMQINTGEKLTSSILDKGFEICQHTFDKNYGGFGPAPKFPIPHKLMFLMRYAFLNDVPEAMEMAEHTLISMYRGGMYDHIGYGFCRYSTDPLWMIPHFEKMLSDNALLAITYLEAYKYTEKKIYARIAKEILTYLIRDMHSEEGGFFASQDADSEGKEGEFYLWKKEEVEELLGDEAGEFSEYYNIGFVGAFQGKSIPNLAYQDIEEKKIKALNKSREILFRHREKRVKPFRDEKILTAWNGLTIAALAMAGRILEDDSYLKIARETVDFIFDNLRRADGRLMGSYYRGSALQLANAFDYEYLIWGLIELYNSDFDSSHLEKALALNEELIKLFWDEEKGGIFYYGTDSEKLVLRPKDFYDGALPADNSVASYNFMRLGRLTGNKDLISKAEQQFKLFGNEIINNPTATTFWLWSVSHYFYSASELFLLIDDNKELLNDLSDIIREYLLNDWLVVIVDDNNKETLEKLVPGLKNLAMLEEQPTAYIANNGDFGAGIKDLDSLSFVLECRTNFLR